MDRMHAALFREQTLLTEVLSQMRVAAAHWMFRGLDTDTISVFMEHDGQGLLRSEPDRVHAFAAYRKNDQAWVEQKNGAIVRRIVGYRRSKAWRPPPN